MKLPKQLAEMLAEVVKKRMNEMEPKVVGQLTDAEKVQNLELDDLLESIRLLQSKFETKKSLFWAGIESRLEIYDRPINLNAKTGELSIRDKTPQEIFEELMENPESAGCACGNCSPEDGDK